MLKKDRGNKMTLEKLAKDAWLNHQLNLRVLKDQIMAKLRAHKFSISSLDCQARNRSFGESVQSLIQNLNH